MTTDAHFEQEEQQLYDDIRAARQALDLFLDSRIVESEAILKPELCEKSMYYALAKAVLLALKSVMTFQSADFEVAINAMQHTVQLAKNIQRQSHSSLWFLTSWIHTGLTPEKLKQMRPLHRHAVSISNYTISDRCILCLHTFVIMYRNWSMPKPIFSRRSCASSMTRVLYHLFAKDCIFDKPT